MWADAAKKAARWWEIEGQHKYRHHPLRHDFERNADTSPQIIEHLKREALEEVISFLFSSSHPKSELLHFRHRIFLSHTGV